MLLDFIWIWPLSSHNSRQFHIKSQTICEKNKQQHDLVKSFKKCGLSKAWFLSQKSTSIQPCVSFFFSGKKNHGMSQETWTCMYIYIYGFWFTFFLRKMNCCFVSFGAMISLQIDGCCWIFFNRKGLRRKGLFFVLHMIQDAVIGCHFSSGVNQAFVSNRCSITNQIFKNSVCIISQIYVTHTVYIWENVHTLKTWNCFFHMIHYQYT